MISFKKFLTEAPIDPWDISWKRDTWEIIVTRNQIYLPPSLIKKYFKPKEIEAFHVTTIEGLYKLKAIQHTRKTISTFTSLKDIDNLVHGFSGDYKDESDGKRKASDVLCKVSGTLILPASDDIYSIPDDKGVRSADLTYIKLFQEFSHEVNVMTRDLYYEIFNKMPTVGIKYLINDLGNNPKAELFKRKVVESYIYMLEKFLKENYIELYNEIYTTHSKSLDNYALYNEFLLSNFHIKEVLIINENEEREDIIKKWLRKIQQVKILNLDEWLSSPKTKSPYLTDETKDLIWNFIKGVK